LTRVDFPEGNSKGEGSIQKSEKATVIVKETGGTILEGEKGLLNDDEGLAELFEQAKELPDKGGA